MKGAGITSSKTNRNLGISKDVTIARSLVIVIWNVGLQLKLTKTKLLLNSIKEISCFKTLAMNRDKNNNIL
jgi:hypothetical protein